MLSFYYCIDIVLTLDIFFVFLYFCNCMINDIIHHPMMIILPLIKFKNIPKINIILSQNNTTTTTTKMTTKPQQQPHAAPLISILSLLLFQTLFYLTPITILYWIITLNYQMLAICGVISIVQKIVVVGRN